MTLADRPGMRHRMLLGRVTVRGRSLVDPARSFLVGQPTPSSLVLEGVEAPSAEGPAGSASVSV